MDASRRRAAIEYVIDGDLRFLAHHDEIRMITRTMIRAGWPIGYSEGFNPQPRISLPLPRRVATASDSQWAVAELAPSEQTAAELFESLSAAAPANVPIRGVTTPLPPGTPHATRADFSVDLNAADADIAAAKIGELLSRDSIAVTRSVGPDKPARAIDIRPLIESLVLDGVVLRMRVVFEGQRSARPIEIVESLGLPPAEYEHRVRLAHVTWDMELAGPNRWPAALERNPLVQEENHDRGREAAYS